MQLEPHALAAQDMNESKSAWQLLESQPVSHVQTLEAFMHCPAQLVHDDSYDVNAAVHGPGMPASGLGAACARQRRHVEELCETQPSTF
jgi:hypothetical protein